MQAPSNPLYHTRTCNSLRLLLTTIGIAIGLSSPAVAQTAASAADYNYRIATSDLIGIKVFQEEDLSTQSRVDADGTVTMPLVGTVRLKGLTVEQASGAITRLLADGYLVSPQVTVNVLSFSKKTFTVLGQVGTPGTFDIPDNQEITLLDAIGKAGGFTRIAARKKIYLKRRTGGTVKVYEYDAKKLSTSHGSHGVVIQDGDIITVPESVF